MTDWGRMIESGEIPDRPLKIVCYGVEGVGKSTWAMGAPSPIFLDGERGTMGLRLKRLHTTAWSDFLSQLQWVLQAGHQYKTVVLDTLDALERLLTLHVCRVNNASSIEKVEGGFGKGWTAVAEQWEKVITLLDKIQAQRGMNVIALAHADPVRFSDPDGADYMRWTLRLSKKSANVWKGWVEEILFATRDVRSTRKDKGKGKGGERVLYTEWSPGREAKNRHNLPHRLPLDWNAFAQALRGNVDRVEQQRERERPPEQSNQAELVDMILVARARISTCRDLGLVELAAKSQVWLDANREKRGVLPMIGQLVDRLESEIASTLRADAEAAEEAEAGDLRAAQEGQQNQGPSEWEKGEQADPFDSNYAPGTQEEEEEPVDATAGFDLPF